MSPEPLLAIETSTTTGSVAVGRGPDVAEIFLPPPTRHAEALLPAIEELLRAAGIAKGDLGGVAVGGGPGSFTGLRIAGATAKALAHALGVPLFAVSGLLVQAASCGEHDGPVCAMFDARRGEVYAGCWRLDGADAAAATLEPSVGDALDFVARLRAHSPLYVGEGAERNRERMQAAGARLSERRDAVPSAAALLRLVAASPERYRIDDARAWQPEYVRASSAERGSST